MGAPGQLLWLPYAIGLPATVAGLVALSRIRISVADGELRVDDAHIPVTCLTEINILDPEAKRQLLGPVADPMAFVVQRPWVRNAIRVVVDDPADPTPYWIISSRRRGGPGTGHHHRARGGVASLFLSCLTRR